MTTARHPRPTSEPNHPEQLTLLSTPDVPLQFRLDERTRLRGLAQIERIRAQLAALAEQHDASAAPQRRRAA
jgi:hypothetical protein